MPSHGPSFSIAQVLENKMFWSPSSSYSGVCSWTIPWKKVGRVQRKAHLGPHLCITLLFSPLAVRLEDWQWDQRQREAGALQGWSRTACAAIPRGQPWRAWHSQQGKVLTPHNALRMFLRVPAEEHWHTTQQDAALTLTHPTGSGNSLLPPS